MTRISIIMSVHNEAPYIRQCLDSVIAQTEKDIELIAIDDGSTDGTFDIINEYALRDKRITAIRERTSCGQIIRREEARKLAKGEYITILDGDDFLAPDAISSALDRLQKTGAASCVLELMLYYGKDDVKRYSVEDFPETIDGKTAFILGLQGRLHGICVEERRLYDLVPFDCSCSLYSDDNTARMHYYLAGRICFCHGKYYYRQHRQSETHKVTIKRFQYVLADISLKRELQAHDADTDTLRELEIHRWKNLFAHYRLRRSNAGQFTSMERREALAIIRSGLRSIDFRLLPLSLLLRPPYLPARGIRSYIINEELYFAAHRIYALLRPGHK